MKFKCDSGKLVESSTHEPGLVDGSSESRIGNQLESLKLKNRYILVKAKYPYWTPKSKILMLFMQKRRHGKNTILEQSLC